MKQATMNGYFYVLTAIDLFVLSFMCILTKLSESLNKKQKQGFFLAFALIAEISVLEVVTLAVDGTPAGYRWLNILSNYLGFGLSPGVCLCLVYVMDRKKRMNRWFRAAVCCEVCYLLFLALSIPAGLVFSVSADNVYSRGQYFYIYIILYFAAIVYLSVSTIVTAREFQNRSRALNTPLVQKLAEGLRFPPKRCARCLKACDPAKVPYCITHALIEAVKGNVEEGLFFCGANVGQLDRMRSVRELMDELMDDWRKHQ